MATPNRHRSASAIRPPVPIRGPRSRASHPRAGNTQSADKRGAIRPGVRMVPRDEGSLQNDFSGVTALTFEHRAAGPGGPGRSMTLKRTAITATTAFITINIWTGAPLLALWVGAQVAGHRSLSMAAG